MGTFGRLPWVKEKVLSGWEEDFQINRHKRVQLRGLHVSRKVRREEGGRRASAKWEGPVDLRQ